MIDEENEAMQRDAKFYILLYVIIGVESGLGIFLQVRLFLRKSGQSFKERKE